MATFCQPVKILAELTITWGNETLGWPHSSERAAAVRRTDPLYPMHNPLAVLGPGNPGLRSSCIFPSRAPAVLLNPILGLRLGCRLPLHISGRICATTFQRHNVINHESRTSPAGSSRRRAWVLVPELTLRYRAPFDVAAGVALTG
jgi:hypothetical protein